MVNKGMLEMVLNNGKRMNLIKIKGEINLINKLIKEKKEKKKEVRNIVMGK
jgi:hypothetical protein